MLDLLRWMVVLTIAFAAGKLMTKIKMPSILGWQMCWFILPLGLAGLWGGRPVWL